MRASATARWLVPGLTGAVLLAFAGGYSYHRDELYFLAAGRHLAWGYLDQGPVTPLFARIATELFGDSLLGLRVVPALLAVAVVSVTATIARDIGGGRAEQVLAAACVAVSAILLQAGHLLLTTTTGLLAWALISLFAARALRAGGGPRWLPAGLVAGVGLLNEPRTVLLLGALVVALAAVGPRRSLRDPWFWAAGAVAALLWAPFLTWQATHGWPFFDAADGIVGGGSTGPPWWSVVLFQVVLVGLFLVPVWVAGIVALARDPALRALPLAFGLVAVALMATGGSAYDMAGMHPLVMAAGAGPAWRRARSSVRRRARLGAAVAVSGLVHVVLMLPVVPERELDITNIRLWVAPVGDTIGWPALAATVAGVAAAQPPGAVVLAQDYGQAGAVQRFAPWLDTYSGHHSYADWGTPPPGARTVVVVGYTDGGLRRWFGDVAPAADVDNDVRPDNEEEGGTVWVCREPVRPWPEMWTQIRRL